MRVWTIQPLAVWDQIETEGIAHVEPELVTIRGVQYRWLVPQLRQRLTRFTGPLPWWAYCAKPDLREYRQGVPRGERHVRIELEPEPGTFLVFPCWAWNRIFSNRYLALTLAEQEDWEWRFYQVVTDHDTWPHPEPFRSEREASWQRLFSPVLPSHSYDVLDSGYDFDLGEKREAVLGALRRSEVRNVTHFVGCRRW